MDEDVIVASRSKWQHDVVNMLKNDDVRKVHFIMHLSEEEKRDFLKIVEEEQLASEIPRKLRSQRTIMNNAFMARNKNAFVMHDPGKDDGRTWEFYACVENIKDGFLWCFHGRKFARERMIDSPSVVVLTDRFPNRRYIKPDCWLFWLVVDDSLVQVKHPKFRSEEIE